MAGLNTSQIVSESELDGDAQRGSDARRRHRWYAAGIVLALALGAAAATRDAWLPGLQRLMLYAGKSYLQAMQADGIRGSGATEYLVVLRNEAARADTLAFIAAQPRMTYAGESIYPRTVRVVLKVPVTDARNALESLPSVDFVMPNNPLLICH